MITCAITNTEKPQNSSRTHTRTYARTYVRTHAPTHDMHARAAIHPHTYTQCIQTATLIYEQLVCTVYTLLHVPFIVRFQKASQ